jgi:WD40 repeat protein
MFPWRLPMATPINLLRSGPCRRCSLVFAVLALLAAGGPCPGQEINLRVTLKAHQEGVPALAFSPDGKTLATAGRDDVVRLWAAATGKELAALRHTNRVACLAFSPDSKTLVVGGLGRVKDYYNELGCITLWDVATGRQRACLTGYEPLSLGEKVRGTLTGKQRWPLTGHRGIVLAVAVSPDGRTLASGGDDGHIILWDLARGKVRRDLQGDSGGGDIRSLAFSPDGRRLAWTGINSVMLWDLAGGEEGVLLGRHDGWANCLAFSPDGRTLASGGWFAVKLWEVSSGTEKSTLKTPCQQAMCLAFSPDGKTLAWGGTDDVLRLWQVADGRADEVWKTEGPVSCLAYSPDGRTLVAGDRRGAVKLWDVLPASRSVPPEASR